MVVISLLQDLYKERGGCMSRLVSCGVVGASFFSLFLSLGCGGSKTTTPVVDVTPDAVTLSPIPDVSVEIGGTANFTATTLDKAGTLISPPPPIFFISNNTAVLEVSASGLACAGKWDSLSNPQICTPGAVGTAIVTATSGGVSSPPATVHVHQHIDKIVVTPIPNQTPLAPTLPTDICNGQIPTFNFCLSKTLTYNYQANACGRGVDITPTVGPFNWQSLNPSVADTSTTAATLVKGAGQVQVTAVNPGMTGIFASNGGSNSPPLDFTTCAVQSISLAVTNTDQTSFTVQSGSKSITATVFDTSNTQILDVPLTWSTSDAAAFTASGGITTSVKPGSATIIASCTPPTCNIGFPTPQAIYPEGVIRATGTGTGTVVTTTVWVASSRCDSGGVHSDNCVSTILPIDTTSNAVGVGVDLPALPDSLVFDRQSTKAYLGTDSSLLKTVGLTIVTPATSTVTAPTTSSVLGAPGKVLAISPDGQKILVSDTIDTPNQVFIVTIGSTANTTTPLLITGATAADFSADSSKAYIVAGSNLYVYSPIEALKQIPLGALANDVSFIPGGSFAYIAGGSATNQVTVRKTCDNQQALDDAGDPQNISSLASTPIFLKALPSNAQVLAVHSAGVDLIDVTTMGTEAPGLTATAMGCAPPSTTPSLPGGLPTVVNVHKPESSFNFGQGNLTPSQFIVSSDGTRLYILSDLNNIIVFNIDSETTSTIQLFGGAAPVRASLTTDGKLLYVVATDPSNQSNSVHVVDTTTNTDITQIVLPQNPCHPKAGFTGQFTCNADLIAVRP
jgi:hypothetical protein